ncbi:MAG: hypothetical protein QOG83_3288 [Alphaproteobacteria bacterium]|nr:hypothetical protein [Alphaproteobacteria bacterium]
MRGIVQAACILLSAAPALGAETVYGRWAVDPAACKEHGMVLSVAPTALQWPDTLCAVRRSYRVAETWYASAHCLDAASDIAVQLRMKGGRLHLDWAGTPVEFHRCP